MAGSFTTYWADKVLDHTVGKTDIGTLPTIYMAAFTAAPTDAGGGTECTGGAYERKQTAGTDFSASSSRAITNSAAIQFIEATGSWGGNVVAVAGFDAATVGNMIFWDAVTSTAVAAGTILEIAAGDLDISIAAGS